MSFSYDPSLPTDKDWVRFLVADTVDPTAQLQDEEIEAVIAEESPNVSNPYAVKYVAAARVLGMLQGRWAAAGNGVVSKTVSRLSIEWGVTSDVGDVIQYRIDSLLKRAAELCTTPPLAFKTLGRSNTRGFW